MFTDADIRAALRSAPAAGFMSRHGRKAIRSERVGIEPSAVAGFLMRSGGSVEEIKPPTSQSLGRGLVDPTEEPPFVVYLVPLTAMDDPSAGTPGEHHARGKPSKARQGNGPEVARSLDAAPDVSNS